MLITKDRIPLKSIILIGFLPSFVKKFYYRLRGYKISRTAHLGMGSIIKGKYVFIGDHVKIGFLTFIRARKIEIRRNVTIGAMTYMDTETIEIDEDTRIREQVYVGGISDKDSLLKIGKRCLIMQMTYINPTRPVVLKDDSAIGGHSLLFTHSSWLSALEGYPVKFGPINIGKKVWLPWRTFITSDVTIGDNVIIAPNTLINQNVPSDSMAHGYPLKILPNIYHKPLNEGSKKQLLTDIIEKFIDYLEYHRFSIEKINSSSFEHYRVSNPKIFENLIILVDSKKIKEVIPERSVILLMNESLVNAQIEKSNFDMLISISNLQRYGSSKLGEELVRYFSRYGIRFERMD